MIVPIVLDAVSVGGLYALTALGIGLIFGVMRLINFAHSELVTIAAYTLLWLGTLAIELAMAGALAVAVLLALATERIAFRPLRAAQPATLLIASFALSFLIQKAIALAEGARPKGIDILPALAAPVAAFGYRLQLLQIVTIATCMLLLIALTLFLRRTRFGLEIRAAAENFRMAQLLGVRANRVIAVAFAISGILAATAAVLYVAQTGILAPRMGLQLVIIAFVATVIGGLGNLAGAAAGGFLVGVVSVVLQSTLPDDLRAFREMFVYIVVSLVLLLRPEGLFPARGVRTRV